MMVPDWLYLIFIYVRMKLSSIRFFKGEKHMANGNSVVKTGLGFGSVLAITISWSVNQSIIWAVIHGIFSWFYVIYYALIR